jgi:hypothetical protein
MPTGTNITYTEIVRLLPSYLERKDAAFAAEIPTFVNLAENRIATDMKQEGFQSVVTGTFALSNVQDKPAFWRETISFSYQVSGVWTTLKLRPLEWCKRYWPNPSETDLPQYYADYNINHFYLAATPPAAYPFELAYYARLNPLSESNNENWMTLNAPQALLYACLLEAAMWCKNPIAEEKWLKQYALASGGLVKEDTQRLEDRNAKVRKNA